MSDAPKLFDLLQIEENWGGVDDGIYRTILALFAAEARTLRADITAGSAPLDRLAHSLAGAAANVGARRLAACARALENAPPGAAGAALAALDDALDASLAVIAAGGPAADG